MPSAGALPAHEPQPVSALATLGLTRRLAWALVLAAAAVLVAFMPAAPLNVGASGVLALAGIVVLIIDRVREPHSTRGLVAALVALVVLLGSVGLAIALIGPLTSFADLLAGA
ncbi:hypothetical protein GCM10011490_21620 [Pseudoclavibacter endophyticus]|nr:hypothetical protein GCM10011490_21620 [Pseudoclavibacter endophyticus]